MKIRAEVFGTVLAFLALVVALLNWLSPFTPIGPSPLEVQKTQTPIPYITPTDAGSGETVDELPTARILASPITELRESAATPAQLATPHPTPRIYNFSACKDRCTGANSTTSFPAAIEIIYLEWQYENIPYGAHYVRKWTMNGREWIRYECTWTGSKNGRDSVKLTEPKGLHSGTWELIIIVDDSVLLTEQINVQGNWDFWDPAGTLNRCYGITN